jgi:uncharacterized protein YjeT (DUF2065 family)
MAIALIASKVLGVYLVVSGLFLIFRGKTVPNLLKDFFGHPAIVYLTGVILVFLSTLLLLNNNVWDSSWRMIVTILGWLVLLKGLAYIFIPESLHRMVNRKILGSLSLFGVIAVAAGVYLFYLV